jgi:hypothetical protein
MRSGTLFAPCFSVLIPWCDRDEIQTTLADNSRWFESHAVEVLMLNCGGDTTRLRELLGPTVTANLRNIHIPSAQFNKSLALNLGIFLSHAPNILILDCDIILNSDFLELGKSFLLSNAFVTLAQVVESNPDHGEPLPERQDRPKSPCIRSIVREFELEFIWSDGRSTKLITNRENAIAGSRAGPGIMIAKKEDLVLIGGYNSELEFWGWEDSDVQLRLQLLLRRTQVECGEAIHLSHGDEQRILGGKQKDERSMGNFTYLCSRYCRGELHGTYSRDVAEWQRLVEDASSNEGF